MQSADGLESIAFLPSEIPFWFVVCIALGIALLSMLYFVQRHPDLTKTGILLAKGEKPSQNSNAKPKMVTRIHSPVRGGAQAHSAIKHRSDAAALVASSAAAAAVASAKATVATTVVNSATLPAMKKRVAFADEAGLQLVTIRFLQSDPNSFDYTGDYLPSVPALKPTTSIFHTLAALSRPSIFANKNGYCNGIACSEPNLFLNHCNAPRAVPGLEKHLKAAAQWELDFKQPVSDYHSFTKRLSEQNVSLENIMLSVDRLKLSGFIKVRNIAFEKEVFVRASFDGWKTFEDKPARYVIGVPGDVFDTFSFEISIPMDDDAHRKIEFCICYRIGHDKSDATKQFWDSNSGANYSLSSKRPTSDKEQRQSVLKVSSSFPALSAIFQDEEQTLTDIYDLQLDEWSQFAAWKHVKSSAPYW